MAGLATTRRQLGTSLRVSLPEVLTSSGFRTATDITMSVVQAHGNSLDEGFSALPTTRKRASDGRLLVVTRFPDSNPATGAM